MNDQRKRFDCILNASAHVDEFIELVNGETLPTVLPFVVGQDDVIEAETLTLHVEEPHAHSAGPEHEPDELAE